MPIDPKFRRECAVILYANTLGRLRSRLAAAPVSVPEYVALMANAKRLRSPEPRPAHHRPQPRPLPAASVRCLGPAVILKGSDAFWKRVKL